MSGDRAREEIAAALTDDDVAGRLVEAMESSARGNTYAQWAAHILPTVRALMAEAAAKALEAAADRPDLKSAMGRDAVGCQTLRDRARALTAAHTEESRDVL